MGDDEWFRLSDFGPWLAGWLLTGTVPRKHTHTLPDCLGNVVRQSEVMETAASRQQPAASRQQPADSRQQPALPGPLPHRTFNTFGHSSTTVYCSHAEYGISTLFNKQRYRHNCTSKCSYYSTYLNEWSFGVLENRNHVRGLPAWHRRYRATSLSATVLRRVVYGSEGVGCRLYTVVDCRAVGV
jgi:hypothetical protein